jgi:hypothetical protein
VPKARYGVARVAWIRRSNSRSGSALAVAEGDVLAQVAKVGRRSVGDWESAKRGSQKAPTAGRWFWRSVATAHLYREPGHCGERRSRRSCGVFQVLQSGSGGQFEWRVDS